MSNYYFLTWKNTRQTASAFAPAGTKLDHQLIPELDGLGNLPFKLNLVKLTEGKSELVESNDLTGLSEIWTDYLPNSLAWPLMSPKLQEVIEKHLTGEEGIDWIKTQVTGNGEQKTYYILRFNKVLDVLNFDKTLFVEQTDHVIRPCFSLLKVSSLTIFHKPSSDVFCKITSGLYINEQLKKAIQKEKLTGIAFEKARTD